MFGAGALAVLRRDEREPGTAWALFGFAGLVLQNAAFTGVIALRLALASSDGDAAPALWPLHDTLFTLNGTFLAVALTGLSLAGLQAGLVRPWLARLSLASATLQFTSATLTPLVVDHDGPLGLLGLTGWLLWVIWLVSYGITLIRLTPGRRAAGATEEPAIA
ncbi:hypothetical protein IAG44_18870 [Streptomyces roseirectus]|uniref:Integral membrane protein n=1 Tax=Streptomyces roseirectus TaxID=2768066 RepID=A0A7H0ISS7_9ACTN|nr:hypothetical protein IAG44_18870 [Streptomyces roseirectus]